MALRQNNRLTGGLDYTLNSADGRHLFGTRSSVRCTPGWVTITAPPDGDEPEGQLEKLEKFVTTKLT